ncbi:hypothetical protein CM15mP43_07670 [bacterium]|nr:MAG: hypothetical protein CM15mP43_07670 [bacterium]
MGVFNSTYQELQDLTPVDTNLKYQTFHGLQRSSILKRAIIDALSSDCSFMNLGYYVKKTDNFIRFIDVKIYTPNGERKEEIFEWGILLRTPQFKPQI